MKLHLILALLLLLIVAAGCKKNYVPSPGQVKQSYKTDRLYCKDWSNLKFSEQNRHQVRARGKGKAKGHYKHTDAAFGLTKKELYNRCMRKRGWSNGSW